MSFEHYIRSGQRLLRCGYTTGTCAALAAQGAAMLLLTGKEPHSLSLMTRKGIEVCVDAYSCGKDGDGAWCSVKKDAGDDSDVTDGIIITATVRKTDKAGFVDIDGGAGIGRVTKSGLNQPVGQAAINSVPREMIKEQVLHICDELDYDGGIKVIISAPEGEKTAERTFNPMLGVEGGISILGTSGIVEPMSEKAIVDTIAVELHQASLKSKSIILTPGNYGQTFLHEQEIDKVGIPIVKCSNFIGDSIDIAVTEGFGRIFLVSHIGKAVKLAGGIMNTHSRCADCRRELFCAHAAIHGADTKTCLELMSAATTDACIAVLIENGLKDCVLTGLINAAQKHLEHRAAGKAEIGLIVFSNEYGILGKSGEITAQAAGFDRLV